MESNSDTHSDIFFLHERELMRMEINNLKEQVKAYQSAVAELKDTIHEDKEIIRTLLNINKNSQSRSANRTDINICK